MIGKICLGSSVVERDAENVDVGSSILPPGILINFMFLEIKKYPDPILRKKCQAVEKVDEEVKKLAEEMLRVMYANKGAGLAAPQVGVLKRIIVFDLGQGPEVYINPKILKKQGRMKSLEGCLSLPEVSLEIKRASKIRVEALNKKGEKKIFKAEGLRAFVLQHETDHLNGILILDRKNPFIRWRDLFLNLFRKKPRVP